MNSPNYISPHFQKVHYPSSSIRDFRAAEGLNGGQVGDPVKLVNVTKTEYMYKYNGFEYQDELGLGWYDYGARNYDAAIGRWMNVDPLAELYESQANYDYSGNNPVRFVDFNGENYGVKITHDDDKKEILIQANLYFTNSEDLSENIEAIIMWGLSEGTYTTQDGISYDISFDLKAKVIEGKEETDEARADPIGNIIHENDEIQFRRNYEDDFKRKFNDLTGGYTKNNLAIYNRRSVANAMTRGHEIGHLFGLKDNSGGIMDYSHSFATMKKLNDTNLTKVIKNTLRDIQRIEKGKKARNNAFKIYNIMGEYQGDKSFYKKGVINFKK